jgi:hypothetical protein
LIAAFHYGIVGINAGARIGPAVNVTRAKHDFGKALYPAAFTGRLGAHDVLHRIAGWTGNDASAAICFDCRDEDSQLQRRFTGSTENSWLKIW